MISGLCYSLSALSRISFSVFGIRKSVLFRAEKSLGFRSPHINFENPIKSIREKDFEVPFWY